MIYVFLGLWVISSLLIVLEQRITRIIIFLGIFSLISSVCFLLFGAPDVAMAEAAISSFSAIIFIICFEKYYGHDNAPPLPVPEKAATKKKGGFLKQALPLVFCAFLFGLFVFSIPQGEASPYLKDQYVALFSREIGGENAVTAIYLGYRMYDTLFEALMLLVSVVAVAHLSHYGEVTTSEGELSHITRSTIGSFTIRMICPVILVFGVYLIMNGHLSPGGGFQGGVALAAFFICRYLIYDIFDMQIGKIFVMEKLIFSVIVLLPVLFIFMGLYNYFPQYRNTYLVIMNSLIGMKVCCGFIIIFYRYIAFEKR